ncbi:MAG: hypothetical protein WCA77_09470, partial [Thermoplasmata archaeon]
MTAPAEVALTCFSAIGVAGMAVVTGRWVTRAKHFDRLWTLLPLVAAFSAYVGLAIALWNWNTTSIALGFVAGGSSGAALTTLIVWSERLGMGTTARGSLARLFTGVHFPSALAVSLLVLVSVMMGADYALVVSPGAGVRGGIVGFVTSAVDSPAFLLPVVALIFLSVALLWRRLESAFRYMLLLPGAILLLSPLAIPLTGWSNVSVYAEAALIVGTFVGLMQYMYRSKQLYRPVALYMVAFATSCSVFAAGFFLWVVTGAGAVLAFASLGLLG